MLLSIGLCQFLLTFRVPFWTVNIIGPVFQLTRVTSHHIAYLVVLRTFLIVDCSHTLIPFTCVNLSVRVELLYSFLSLACLYRFTGCLLVTSWPRVTSSLVCRISGGRFVVHFTLNILYSLSLSFSGD